MRTLVILPGLDGTATMHESFVVAAREFFDAVTVISYPTNEMLDYRQLELRVRSVLPPEPFVLLGESFSGPIALAIGEDPPPGLRALVLSTSFARAPLPFAHLLAPLARFAPVRSVPQGFLSWLLLGRWASTELLEKLRAALESVEVDVLRSRAAAALLADVRELKRIRVPVLYLRALHDRLMPRRAVMEMARVMRTMEVTEIPGPHLLLQAAPLQCAQAVGRFASA